jgi:hypothetical protein
MSHDDIRDQIAAGAKAMPITSIEEYMRMSKISERSSSIGRRSP